jgi:hypothetical protein
MNKHLQLALLLWGACALFLLGYLAAGGAL